MYCKYCGNQMKVRFWLPGKCKRCKHSFDWKPGWIPNVILLVSLLPPLILAAVFRPLGLMATIGGFLGGFVLTFVLFNLLEVLCYHKGVLTSELASEEPVAVRTHIKKPLSELDPLTRAEVEISRIQLPEGVTLGSKDGAKGAEGVAVSTAEPAAPATSTTPARPAQARPSTRPSHAGRPRCRFERVRPGQTEKVADLSRLATAIVREHFDPIIGPEQNDYMISLFQTPEAIMQQLAEGYEYSFVCPPGTTGEEPPEERRIGFVAFQRRGADELYLSKFYLKAEERGKGYSHDMLDFVCREGRRQGCSHVRLNVNRNNYQAILAYEHLGFAKVGEAKQDIGNGFVMDDFVYELPLD